MNLGKKLTLEESNDFIKQADLDKDGQLNFKDFKRFMTMHD
jgi:Ca2+-binding EF-hand superfamily protein